MRLLHVSHSFLTERAAGVEVFLSDLLPAQHARGDEVAIYHGRDRREGRNARVVEGLWQGILRRRITRASLVGVGRSTVEASAHDRAVEGDFARFLERWRPDVVHVHHTLNLSCRLIELARAAGARVLLTLHDHWFFCPRVHLWNVRHGAPCAGPERGLRCASCHEDTGLSGLARSIARLWPYRRRFARHQRALAACDRITVPARFQRAMLEQAGVAPNRVRQVPYGVEPTRAIPPGRRRAGGRLRAAYLGALAPHKGLELLLEAGQRLDERHCEIQIWGAEPRGDYQPWWEALKPRFRRPPFTLCGAYLPDEVGLCLQQADVLVVPSLWAETGPLVVLEAFLAGVPVVAAGHGGMAELVQDDQNGAWFTPGDCESLRAVLRDLTQDPGRVQRWRVRLPTPPHIGEVAAMFDACYREILAPEALRAAPALASSV